MLEVATWFAVVYVLWLAAVPFAWLALPNLHSRGLGFARPLGLLAIASVVWLSSLSGLIPSVGATWWLAVVVLGAIGWGYLLSRKRSEVVEFVSTRWREVVVAEIAFLLFFFCIVALKASDPVITGTEKPMDLTMLNAVVADRFAPPQDLWLSGFDIAYYYFGYWMFGGISQMSGIGLSTAYNLSLALIAGMAAGGIVSLVTDLVRRDGGRFAVATLCGGAAVLALLVMSNLNGFWEMLAVFGIGGSDFYNWLSISGVDTSEAGNGWRPTGFWWWWASSRVINSFGMHGEQLDFTIQEFPFFSFLLGDMHPHVMSIPFVLLSVGMAANILWSRATWGWRWIADHKASAIGILLIVGASGFINTWDLIVVVPLLGLAALINVFGAHRRDFVQALTSSGLPFLALCAVAAIVFANFYFFTLQSQVGFPPIAPTQHGTRLIHAITVWLPLMSLAVPFVYGYVSQGLRRGASHRTTTPFRYANSWVWLVPLGVCAFIYASWLVTHLIFNQGASWLHLIERVPVSLPLLLVSVGLWGTTIVRARRRYSDAAQVCLMLASIAVFYIFFAEHFYALDFFGNRMNTVFKVYYQAWILLSVVGGYGIYHWIRVHPRLTGTRLFVSRAGAVLVALIFAVSMYYALAASVTKASESNTRTTLDGLAYMESRSPDMQSAVNWIRDNLGDQDVIVESVGGSYSEHGRFSGFSGVPSVLGWSGHERQWRGGDEGWVEREEDVKRIYTSSDLDEVRTLLELYGVTHVVVSDLEREKYTEIDASKFDMLGSVAYSNASVDVYDVRR